MQPTPPSPIPAPPHLPRNPEISATTTTTTAAAAHIPSGEPTFSSLFDWSDFLDFNLDEALNVSLPTSEHEVESNQSQLSEELGRIRKRDPRLVCPNFLAGMVPCACPELDEKLEAEMEALPGKKRARVLKVGGGPVRCQVPGCEVDITELKGYHKRHRVCLRCANASNVVLDGESKRYCQQCGKFHLLSDFDEGKRSCRRKLERHNNRRRRKPNDSKGSPEKEAQNVNGDDSAGKDGTSPSSPIEERDILLESDGHLSTPYSAPAEVGFDGQKQNSNYKLSPSYYEDKNTFSSMCPAGRISFKLYDWNPAEFPRRLRHQIFQWLASMPVELEGYIRPGCTILTAFIAMPRPMWFKLLKEPALFIKDLVASPGNVLSGRGTMLVYLNEMIFRVTKDAHSVVKVRTKSRSPKLHYIFPTCFEAGKPIELVACGSDLIQPKFRFLISFGGQYLAYKICVSSLCCKKGGGNNGDHQLVNISVPQTDANLFGPAFIEVENQSGLSNFIPILVGDKETCAEMAVLQQRFNKSASCQEQHISPPKLSCEVFALKQAQFSDFMLDVAWLLKKPGSDQQLTSSQVQRFSSLLNFLIELDSSVILERIVCAMESAFNSKLVTGISDDELTSLQNNIEIVQCILDHKLPERDSRAWPKLDGKFYSQISQKDNRVVVPAANKGMVKNTRGVREFSLSPDASATLPLLNRDVIMNVDLQTRPRQSRTQLLSRSILTSRPLIMAIAALGVCCGVCVVALHPQRVGQMATTIRRCLFDQS